MSFTGLVDVNKLFLIADQDKDGVVGVEDARRFFAGAGISGQALGMLCRRPSWSRGCGC